MSQTLGEFSGMRPLTPAGAAQYLGVDVKTITRWARQGYLPAHPLGEGKRKFWRFLVHELSAWLSKRTNSKGPDDADHFQS
jgi:excisionase family DNA binding protein